MMHINHKKESFAFASFGTKSKASKAHNESGALTQFGDKAYVQHIDIFLFAPLPPLPRGVERGALMDYGEYTPKKPSSPVLDRAIRLLVNDPQSSLLAHAARLLKLDVMSLMFGG